MKNGYVQYAVMFMKERLLRLNVRYVTLRLRNSRSSPAR